MGEILLLGAFISSVGYMARKLLVSAWPGNNFRYLCVEKSPLGFLEKEEST